jgi:aryl-alcohol dehydrogenase-like predicted oxidoreductase
VTALGEGDFRHNAPRFAGDALARNNDRYAPVRDLADGLGLAPGQLALAWLLAQDPHVVPIPGSRTPAHVVENTEAARIVLDVDTLRRVDDALAAFEPEGGTLL